MFPMMALVNSQGTAMAETGLCSSCYDNELRIGSRTTREFARSLAWEQPAREAWQDCGDNEAIYCEVCGFNQEEEENADCES